LRGLEEGLFENLCSLADQDYPMYELVLGAEDPSDPALAVAACVRTIFPSRSITIVAGAPRFGQNPKVRNLANLADHARFDHFLISDSDVRARRDYLSAMAAELARPGVGLVTSLLAGTGGTSFGALCENLHLSSFVVSSIATAQVIGHPVVIGKSMLFSRRVLSRLGGFASVADLLAEDYVLGRHFARSGFRVVLSTHVLPIVYRQRSVGDFLSRHLRWAQLRRRVSPATYFAEPLLYPTPWALAVLLLAILRAGPGWLALAAVSAVMLKVAADAVLGWRIRHVPWRPRELAVIPIKDLLVIAVWVVGVWKRTVTWRGHRLWLGAGSRIRS
jgi:ceramide glucosyltransferase